MTINLIGTVIVYTLASWVVPIPHLPNSDHIRIVNLVAAAIYGGTTILLGVVHYNVVLTPIVRWIREDAPPDDERRRTVLRAPQMVAQRHAGAWAGAAVLFGLLNTTYSFRLGATVTLIVALAGLTVSTFTYLVTERALRGFARRALETGASRSSHSVVKRSMMSWSLGSGVLLFGCALVGLFALIDPVAATRQNLAVTMLVLGSIGLVLGGLAAFISASASADPLRSLRRALELIERGDYTVTIPIYDATEIGHLQMGFNQMAGGLREREQLRDLFGRHVGEDVARLALAKGVALGGEAREIAVLFVDIIGSTTLAEDRDPVDVVALLNRFFAVVVDVVQSHGGWINKFEGDAALAVWGTPVEVPDQATTILRAARVLHKRLNTEVPELKAGIGVSTGRAVAGNVGAEHRSEYTVIGDPVNEAARLTDLAKTSPAQVMARADLLENADPSEASFWEPGAPVQLRGRTSLTPVASPVRSQCRDDSDHRR